MRDQIVKRYTLNGITVIWKPALCIHSGVCVRGLPKVFDPTRRPWIELHHADNDTITDQVERCPSGALSWTFAEDEAT